MTMFETHDHTSDFSTLLCVVWTGDSSAVLCSQPKRGALRRQARIDQHTQEQLQDPWVRLSDSSPEELSEIHHHHCHHIADRTQPLNVHSMPATMSDKENNPGLNGTATDVTSDPPADMISEITSETPAEAKKGPPVAPKPTWFRQSLRKIRDEQDQKKQDKPAGQRPTVGFNKSFGVRSASSAAKLSIQQKIHSFESFSSPEGPEKGGNRRLVAPSTSLPVVEKESRSYPASHGDDGKSKDEIPKEFQPNQPSSVRMTDSKTISATPSAITSSTSEASNKTTAKSSEEEPPPFQYPTDLPCSDTISTDLGSGTHDSSSAAACDDGNTSPPKQEPEQQREDLHSSTEPKALPPATSVRFSQVEGKSPPEEPEGDGAWSLGKPMGTTVGAAPPADSQPLRGLEAESLGRIFAFSNQVIMRNYGNVLYLSYEDYLKGNSSFESLVLFDRF